MHNRYTTRQKSKKKRIKSLVLTGIMLIGVSFVLSKILINSNEQVYEPIITSSYQPDSDIKDADSIASTDDQQATPAEPEEVKQQPTWPVTYTLEEANSLTVVVNKKHKLPSDYVPDLVNVAGGQMRPEAAAAMEEMLTDAENTGNSMVIISSYRSYQTQVSTYQYWVNLNGQEQADRESARPGHSEHQTGLTADLGNPDGSCRLLACFGTGSAGTWLASNAHKYGFIIRYPDGEEDLTGYIYEPWHVRYVGTNIASAIYNSGLTMDQYYDVPAGDY